MLACVDVDYRDEDTRAVAACVLFEGWEDEEPARELAVWVDEVAAYAPGEFYRRELPCIVAVLAEVPDALEAVVVDGYVWLSGDGRPGLGAHLYRALGERVPVIGVAKNPFAGSGFAVAVCRGTSQTPLYVTAAGAEPDEAARHVETMHGAYRMPTMLRRVDRLCRAHGRQP